MICDISDGQTRGNHAEPSIERGKFPQERLESGLSKPPLLRSGRVLERFETIQDQQGSPAGYQLGQSFALSPWRSNPRVWIAKPGEGSLEKFICRRGTTAAPLPVKGPAKNKFCRTIMVGGHSPEPMVDERGLSNAGPGNNHDDIHAFVHPGSIQKSKILLPTKNTACRYGQPCDRNS